MITLEIALQLHTQSIKDYGGLDGVKDFGML